MLIKLLPDQISTQWKVIRYAIEEALPPISFGAEDRSDRILMKLLKGDMHCWVSMDRDQQQMNAILTTMFTGDPVLGVRNLLLYSLYGMGFGKKDFSSGMLTLYRFAEANNCNRIVGYTDNPEIIKMVERIKGEARYRFVSVPIS